MDSCQAEIGVTAAKKKKESGRGSETRPQKKEKRCKTRTKKIRGQSQGISKKFLKAAVFLAGPAAVTTEILCVKLENGRGRTKRPIAAGAPEKKIAAHY